MNKNALIGIIAVVVLVGGGVAFLNSSNTQSNSIEKQAQPTQTQETAVQQEEVDQADPLATRYLDYSEANLAKATQKAVIFFKASWCPSCQAADKDFRANFDQVPADVTILKADYDTETALKEKYNIAMQDTFVQVDGTGTQITQWNSGGKGVETLLANIQ